MVAAPADAHGGSREISARHLPAHRHGRRRLCDRNITIHRFALASPTPRTVPIFSTLPPQVFVQSTKPQCKVSDHA